MNVKEALHVLSKRDITHSEQMVRRWIRSDKLKATKNSKRGGYEIAEHDLISFIWNRYNENNKGKHDFVKEFERNRQLQKDYDFLYEKLEEANRRISKLIVSQWSTGTNINTLFGDEAETKKTFRTMLNKMHPDNNNGNEEAFKKINKIYKEAFK